MDEVLVASIDVLGRRGTQLVEDPALDVFLLGRSLDGKVDLAELGKRCCGADALQAGVAGFPRNHLAVDLPVHVALDGLEAGVQSFRRDIVEEHVEPGERADVRNAVAHLSCADHADALESPTWVLVPAGEGPRPSTYGRAPGRRNGFRRAGRCRRARR